MNSPSSTPEAREWMIGNSCYFPDYGAEDFVCEKKRYDEVKDKIRDELLDPETDLIHVIEYSAFEQMRRERDDALSVAAGIEEQAKKNSEYDDWRIEKLQVELARYKRALETAQRSLKACDNHSYQMGDYESAPVLAALAEIERILGVDAKERKG